VSISSPGRPDWARADRLGERVPDAVPLDGTGAVRATAATVVVVAALVALQGSVAALATGGTQPVATAAEVPTDPVAAQWADAPARTVELQAQQMALPYGGGSVDEVDVQAVTNDSHVAFRLAWEDPTRDTSLSAPERYSDAAAVMLKGGEQPPITMGAVGEPVNIWYWRAAWQYDDTTAEWAGDMYAYPHGESQPGQQAGNHISQDHFDSSGRNYYAKGFGSTSDAPAQNVHATAERTDGGWQVTFTRERSTNGTYDAAFGEHDRMYLAVAVWNGSQQEVNGQKSLTYQYATLDTTGGDLTAPQQSGGDASGDGDAGDGDGDAAGSDGGDGLSVGGWMLVLVSVALFTWTAAYWRMRP